MTYGSHERCMQNRQTQNILMHQGKLTVAQPQLCHLALIDFFIDGASSQKSVYEHWALLAITAKRANSEGANRRMSLDSPMNPGH